MSVLSQMYKTREDILSKIALTTGYDELNKLWQNRFREIESMISDLEYMTDQYNSFVTILEHEEEMDRIENE